MLKNCTILSITHQANIVAQNNCSIFICLMSISTDIGLKFIFMSTKMIFQDFQLDKFIFTLSQILDGNRMIEDQLSIFVLFCNLTIISFCLLMSHWLSLIAEQKQLNFEIENKVRTIVADMLLNMNEKVTTQARDLR